MAEETIANNSSNGVVLSYPPNLKNVEENPAWINFSFFDRKSPKDSVPTDVIQLYMPESTQNPSTVSWDTERFGFIGNQIVKGANGAASAWNNMSLDGLGGQIASSTMAALGKMGTHGLANLGSTAASLMGGSVSAEGLMGEIMGKIPNPYLTMVFRGVDFRQFTFTFKFYPFSEADTTTIHSIIKTFRRNALPTYSGTEKEFLGYPKECEIKYKWLKDDNPWMHKFKRSVCTGIDIDYTASGMFSVMRNGFPSEIVMTTKWSEIELVTSEDISEGY